MTTNEEAFAEAQSQLALAPPYTGPEEEDEEDWEQEDNTEKREISSWDAPLHNQLDHQVSTSHELSLKALKL